MYPNMTTARKAAKLTQAEVADRLNIARTTLVAIEAGERRVREHEAQRMASLYGVTLDYLLSDSIAPDTPRPDVTDVTVGLVNSLAAICRVLATRDLSPEEVGQAFGELARDEDFITVRMAAFKARRKKQD